MMLDDSLPPARDATEPAARAPCVRKRAAMPAALVRRTLARAGRRLGPSGGALPFILTAADVTRRMFRMLDRDT